MTDLLCTIDNNIQYLTLNRVSHCNAFDEKLLAELLVAFEAASHNPEVQLLVLRANGPHFSAGADIGWMQRMASFSKADNLADALVLAQVMQALYDCPKPTIAAVQGSTFGGGIGLVAACDIAIATESARFCFSEVKLGLIPAVISPYVIEAMGSRVAKWLFMSAEVFSAEDAKRYQLIHHCVADDSLDRFTTNYAKKMLQHAPQALIEAKALVKSVAAMPIHSDINHFTAERIAKLRVSAEAQSRLKAFLNQKTNKG